MSGSAGAMSEVAGSRDVTVVELLDRLLDKGVVLAGDLTISVAGIDLIELSLRVLVSSTEAAKRSGVPVPSATDALSTDALGSRAVDAHALDAHALDAHAPHSGAADPDHGDAGGRSPGEATSGPLESGALGAEMLGSSGDREEGE